MFTPDRIDAIRQHTGVSVVDAMHALAVANGNVQHAIGNLNDHARSGNRAIIATTRERAQRIAAALIEAGVWFECELTAQAQWRFCVALGAYSKLLAVSHETANGETAAA